MSSLSSASPPSSSENLGEKKHGYKIIEIFNQYVIELPFKASCSLSMSSFLDPNVFSPRDFNSFFKSTT